MGLANVDNTPDTSKPISTATQTSLNLKADIASPTFTGTVVLPNTTSIGSVTATELGYLAGTTSAIEPQINSANNNIALKAPISSPTFTGTVSGITKTMVGLGNVDNTSNITERSATATLSNKTISGNSNTLSDIPESAVTNLTSDLATKQSTLVGVGFVKSSSGTISYDNNTYLTGNQTVNISGDISGSGSTNITATLPNVTTGGTNSKITYNSKGLITGGTSLVTSDISDFNSATDIRTTNLTNLLSTKNITTSVLVAAGSTVLTGLLIVDGYQTVAGDRVFVALQPASGGGAKRGIYIVSSGAWTRATDYDTSAKILGSTVTAMYGTLYGGSVWINNNTSTINIGTDSILYIQPAVGKSNHLSIPSSNAGELVYQTSSTTTLSLPAVALGQVLSSNGTGNPPVWSTLKTVGGTAMLGSGDISTSTNLLLANNTATTIDILSDTGTDVTIPSATSSLAGLQSSADKVKLDSMIYVASTSFTPVVVGTTTAGTGTYTEQTGRYTRIGSTVHYQISLGWSAHTGTGNLKITGMPVTNSASAGKHVPAIYADLPAMTLGNALQAQMLESTTQIVFDQRNYLGGTTAYPLPVAVTKLYVTGTYEV